MVKNYLKMSLRSLRRQKAYSFINLSGLGIGMACCILILLFVEDELSYDRFHENVDQLYRLAVDAEIGGNKTQYAIPPYAAIAAFQSEIPEIEEFVRIRWLGTETQVTFEDKTFDELGMYATDSTFFEVFDFEFISGDPNTALDEPGSIVITESTAKRLFGDDDPMDKVFRISGFPVGAKVAGVIKDVPKNSHFDFNYIISFTAIPGPRRTFLRTWGNINGWTYLRLSEGTDPHAVVEKFPDIVERHAGDLRRQAGIKMDFFLEKMTDIYLHSKLQRQIGDTSDIKYVYTFSTIAIFILVIACINFMNLSTARSANRSREVGVRKVFGAFKTQLISQFLSESVVMAVSGMVLAILIVWLSIPAFNGLSEKELTMGSLNSPVILSILFSLVIFTGIVAGSYPAFFLSAFRPISVLRGQLSQGSGSSGFRKALVVLQFCVSIVLIISTLIVLQQIDFMKNKNLGFAKEQLMVIEIVHVATRGKSETIKAEFAQNPNVISTSFSSAAPGRGGELRLFIPEGAEQSDTHAMRLFRVDYDFLDTYKMNIIQGRAFSRELLSDTSQAFIINESAASAVGWTPESAIDKEFELARNRKGKVIGVVQDFHFESMRAEIGPLALMMDRRYSVVNVKINTQNVTETINFLRETWLKFEPGRPFVYNFVDENFAQMYRSEETLSDIFKTFAAVAIFIACLGLFGLASFTAEQRRKEIGIRKVLGASTDTIVVKLSRDFTIWVVIANIVAWPVTYYTITTYWLSSFPYRIDISMMTFIIAGVVSLLIALLTVSYQSISAALMNPVRALRDE